MSVATSNEGLDSTRSWIVAVACFFVQVLTFGLTEASGLLFVATIPRYNTTREKASLPYAITYCLRSAVGPIVSYIGRRFGIRLVTLFGCVLSAISVASCFFATNILELTLLWGVIFGFSLGLETSLLNVILNEHFEKHLVKANGLNISGASLGTLLLSPIIEHSVETYGLSGTFLIISGLMLNSIPAAFVMILNKPPNVPRADSDTNRLDFKDGTIVVEVSDNITTNKEVNVSIISDKPAEITQGYDLNYLTYESNTSQLSSKSPLIQKILQLRTIKNGNSSMLPKDPSIRPRFWKFKTYSIANIFTSNDITKQNDQKVNKEDHKCSSTLPTISKASTMLKRTSINDSEHDDESNICNVPSTKPMNNTNSKWQLYQLLSEPIYVIIIIGSGTYYFIITTFLTIIVDYSTDLGISTTYSTYIVMWIAVCDIGGYLFQSWIIELRHLSQSQFTSISFLCLCLASAAMVWCTHFIVLLVLIGVFEVAQCGVIILAAPLVAEYMRADLHATGIASLTILSSPMTLAISPLIGHFRDGGGSYAGVFHVLSASSFLCSVLFLCIPKLQKRRQNNQSIVI